MQTEQLPLWKDLLIVTYRTMAVYVFCLAAMRLVGKRSIGQMAAFDLVVVIIMGSVAAIPIEEKSVRLIDAGLSIGILAALEFIVGTLNIRYRTLEKITQGQSTVLVQDGRILEENLRREKITLSDLYISLREKDIDNVQDVQLAVLEPNGRVSVIKKKEKQPVTPDTVHMMTLNRLDALMVQNMERARARASALLEEVGVLSRRRLPP
ncbi:MAG: DUF421 domain-containing protein [Ignavibacteriales bacterium]